MTKINNKLIFKRRGDILKIIHYNSEYRHWGDKVGTGILILNVKNKKRQFFAKEDDEGEYKSLTPSLTNIMPWLEVSTFTDPLFVGSREEALKGTLIEILEQGEEIPLFKYEDAPSGVQTLQDWVKYFPKLFWEILLGDNILEQLLKGGMPYLAMEMLRSRYFFNADKGAPREYAYNRVGIHPKAKNLKECFRLSIKQIQAVNEFIKERWLAGIQDPFSVPPLVPAVHKMDEVLGVQLNCLDITTFESLLRLSDRFVDGTYRRTWFSWCGLSEDYPSLKEIIKNLKPAEFIAWLEKGYNLSEYNDYLGMRNTLKQLSIDTNQPELFSERAFPIKVKEPTEVHRLHDIVSKLNFAYKDAAKSAMFNNAVKEAKHYEFEDQKTETEERMMAILPESVADLVAEGTELHHCVKDAMWIDAIAERKSVIIFIRRCSDKNTPYFTVELDPQGSIRQCHGNSNCDPDTAVIKFLGRWAEAHKGVLKESIVAHYGALCAPTK